MRIKIAAASDLHGHLPDIPPCDLLLLGGDYYPASQSMHGRPQADWFENEFYNWLEENAARGIYIIGVAGNHDFYFEREKVKRCQHWTYLQDNEIVIQECGLKVFGSPHQGKFYDWAFNATESELERRWAAIPDDTDILLLHGPPFGFGDRSIYVGPEQSGAIYRDKQGKAYAHAGSPSLLKRIIEVQPKIVIAGHIHSGFGQYKIGSTDFYNVAHVDEGYQPKNKPVVFELEVGN